MSAPLPLDQLLAEIDAYARTAGYQGPPITDNVTAWRVVPGLVTSDTPPPPAVQAWLEAGPPTRTTPPRRRR